MLESLLIRNFALFEEARIQFEAGLIVLTGETGAGKSLVVDAVNFLCGARADRDVIRADSASAYVEGIFLIDGMPELQALLAEQSLEAEDGLLIVSRELTNKGRSVCRLNGMAFALSFVQEVTARLIDLHGQHEHQSLLHEKSHLKYLDLLGDSGHEALLSNVREAFGSLTAARKAYQQALQSSGVKAERLAVLTIQQKELRDANLVSGEEESLQDEKTLLRNAEKISDAVHGIQDALIDSEQGEPALKLLQQARNQAEKIAAFHPVFSSIRDRLSSVYYELEEVGHDLGARMREIHQDDARLAIVEARLDQLRKLQRKYGPSTEDMLLALQRIELELKQLETLDEDLDRLSTALSEQEKQFDRLALRLSASRTDLANLYGKRIEQALGDLNMPAARFKIQVAANSQAASAEGTDQVRMLIAPNTGEEMKPLSRIASGGELSRVMLAMKTLAAGKNVVPTMVFDEIDTGVSGKTAFVIAQKLWDIGRYRQVICVSHLHQLAAMASHQVYVSKSEEGGRTRAVIRLLQPSERVDEIAKMLGNLDTQGQSSLQHARVLLQDAAEYRSRHAPEA